MSKEQFIHEIGSYLADQLDVTHRDWSHAVIVVEIETDAPDIAGVVHSDKGNHKRWVPQGPEIFGLTLQLRDAMSSADKRPRWKAALIELDRATAEINFKFEYEKTDRWSEHLR